MKPHYFYNIFLLLCMALQACSNKNMQLNAAQNIEKENKVLLKIPNATQQPKHKNPILGIKGDPNDGDPLGIGDNPTLPQNAIDGKPIIGKIFLPEEKNKQFNLKYLVKPQEMVVSKPPNANAPVPPQIKGDYISIMHPSGSILTIWALAQGNWIWGYSLIDSSGFGGARIWRLIFFENDEVMIQNGKTLTCLNGYKNGLIHMRCSKNDAYQRFKLIPMSNGAFMLKNIGFNKCVRADIGNIFGDFHKVNGIFLAACATEENLDQQWYIIPPPFLIRPLYDRE